MRQFGYRILLMIKLVWKYEMRKLVFLVMAMFFVLAFSKMGWADSKSPLVGKWISDSETHKSVLEFFSGNTFKLGTENDSSPSIGTWKPCKDGFEMQFGKDTCIGRYQPEYENRFVITFEDGDYTIFHKLEAAKTVAPQSKEKNSLSGGEQQPRLPDNVDTLALTSGGKTYDIYKKIQPDDYATFYKNVLSEWLSRDGFKLYLKSDHTFIIDNSERDHGEFGTWLLLANNKVKLIFENKDTMLLIPAESENQKSIDISGYKDLKWGDSIEAVKSKLGPQGKIQRNSDKVFISFEDQIGSELYSGKALFTKGTLDAVAFIRGWDDSAILLEEATNLLNAYKIKYGKPTKEETARHEEAFMWQYPSGQIILVFTIQYDGSYKPMIMYKKTSIKNYEVP
jgi:hypothetical protein